MVGKLQRENFSKAVKAGVKITFGTDAGKYPHGWNAKTVFLYGEIRTLLRCRLYRLQLLMQPIY